MAQHQATFETTAPKGPWQRAYEILPPEIWPRELQTSYGDFRKYFWQQQGVETAKIPKNAMAFRKPHNSTEVSQIWGFQVNTQANFSSELICGSNFSSEMEFWNAR
jgi:hypothetical protein